MGWGPRRGQEGGILELDNGKESEVCTFNYSIIIVSSYQKHILLGTLKLYIHDENLTEVYSYRMHLSKATP